MKPKGLDFSFSAVGSGEKALTITLIIKIPITPLTGYYYLCTAANDAYDTESQADAMTF